MLDPHLLARNLPILRLLLLAQLAAFRLLRRLSHHHASNHKPLEPAILIQLASTRQAILLILKQCLVVPLSRVGHAQKANATLLIDKHNVLDRMAVLLPAPVFLLLIIVYGSLDRSFGAIMIKKGVVSSEPSVSAASTAAKRDGSTSKRSKASERTGRSSVSHLLASD